MVPGRATGSTVFTKQIMHTVVTGKRVTAISPAGLEVSGYVSGMDDYHLVLVDPSHLHTWLVHKTGTFFRVDSFLMADEPKYVELDIIIAPFRDFVETMHRGKKSPAEQRKAVVA